MAGIQVGGHAIGPGNPTFVIAELSANHNHSKALAHETIIAAAEAGADAIKLQTYRPETITFPGTSEIFRISDGSQWNGRTLFDLYTEGMTPWDWHAELFETATALGLEAFSSPFDPTAVDFLEDLGVPAFKIASFEITDIPLIAKVAALGKPVIFSTGIAERADIELAVATCREAGNNQLVILKCTSAYPAPLAELNLRTLTDLAARFSCLTGLSDHTMTPTAAVASVALGASVIERHIILDRSSGGLDSGFSSDPSEFALMVSLVREAETALGSVTYDLTPTASGNRKFARSLFVVSDVKAGDRIESANTRSIRPSMGMHPRHWTSLEGRRFRTDVAAGTPLSEDQLEV